MEDEFTPGKEEAKANAKLIAAAPEMLEAISGFIDPSTGEIYEELLPCLRASDQKAILKAYKKATGK